VASSGFDADPGEGLHWMPGAHIRRRYLLQFGVMLPTLLGYQQQLARLQISVSVVAHGYREGTDRLKRKIKPGSKIGPRPGKGPLRDALAHRRRSNPPLFRGSDNYL